MKRLITILGAIVTLSGMLTCMGCDTRQESVTKSSVPQPATQGGGANEAAANKKAGPPMPGP